jgi:16S rRNA C1402 (ribose-2'-O) methylase RsmI
MGFGGFFPGSQKKQKKKIKKLNHHRVRVVINQYRL